MPVFTFDPNDHIYRLDNRIIPGVSDCLEEAGLKHQWRGFQEAQWRGLHVHNATELLDLNELDWESVYPQWIGYVRAYDLFKKETGFVPDLIEFQTYHPTFLYAGTLDRAGSYPVPGEPDNCKVILDIKTGIPEDWHKWQLAGYQLLAGEKWLDARRGALYLNKDGTYKPVVWHDDPADLRIFLAAMTICQIKRSQ